MRSLSVAGLVTLALARVAFAAPPAELEPFSFLVGEWRATGSGEPGAGVGVATFSRALQEQVIVRTSFAEYPAAAGRTSSRHDDLLIMYPHAGGVRADYYDSERHVIRYAVRSPAAGEAIFVSDVVANQPRFRLSYRLESGVLKGEFAIAAAGTPDAFKPYLAWQSTKTAHDP
jgi:hypothetical protein